MQQFFHVPLQFGIVTAGIGQERGALARSKRKSSSIEFFDLTPALGIHPRPGSLVYSAKDWVSVRLGVDTPYPHPIQLGVLALICCACELCCWVQDGRHTEVTPMPVVYENGVYGNYPDRPTCAEND